MTESWLEPSISEVIEALREGKEMSWPQICFSFVAQTMFASSCCGWRRAATGIRRQPAERPIPFAMRALISARSRLKSVDADIAYCFDTKLSLMAPFAAGCLRMQIVRTKRTIKRAACDIQQPG